MPNVTDNCPLVSNPSQVNTDNEIDNGPGIPPADTTVPNAAPDTDGDACETDGDADNDGLPDAVDTEPLSIASCGGLYVGATDGHPNPAGGDITNDDNGNGNPALPMGSDGADNGPAWDTDNDGMLDGVECALGFNPRDGSSKPSNAVCGGSTDADNDGLPAYLEVCKYGTLDTSLDRDSDGKKDCTEAADVDGNSVVNFPGDTTNVSKAANNIIGKTMDFDLDGNGVVNFPGDAIISAKISQHTGGVC